MANLQLNNHIITISRRQFHGETKSLTPYTSLTKLLKQRSIANDRLTRVKSLSESQGNSGTGNALVQQRAPGLNDVKSEIIIEQTGDMDCLVKEYGWKVRRMVESKGEMKMVALIQAHAFHVPSLFFDDFFFHYFQAEVLAALYYRLRNSPPDRYACLVAEHAKEDDASTISLPHQLVGVVDITVLRDGDVLRHLEGAQEYLYVSGIAVPDNYRKWQQFYFKLVK
ncbi:GCN5-related N-acetyltransferase 10, chloroplastic isoform X2 [Silene latifolia]|uniref:GCN5-related N-acetyltransferase 10, chloroplastic isoform X2 n=1 Tax=Silene latifolia TaxID=37657 RepID=UPI003D771B2E